MWYDNTEIEDVTLKEKYYHDHMIINEYATKDLSLSLSSDKPNLMQGMLQGLPNLELTLERWETK